MPAANGRPDDGMIRDVPPALPSKMKCQSDDADFLGLSSMAFPFVGVDGVDYGYLWRGCRALNRNRVDRFTASGHILMTRNVLESDAFPQLDLLLWGFGYCPGWSF